jgi:hypothetical protein
VIALKVDAGGYRPLTARLLKARLSPKGVELSLVEAGDELLGVEGRIGGQSEHLARLDVEHHRRRPLCLREDLLPLRPQVHLHLVSEFYSVHQGPGHDLLELEIERQVDGITRLGGLIRPALDNLTASDPILGQPGDSP